jgi:hypothetical protein
MKDSEEVLIAGGPGLYGRIAITSFRGTRRGDACYGNSAISALPACYQHPGTLTGGIPAIYRRRYVTRSPVRVSVNTRSPPLIDPVAAEVWPDWATGKN